MFTHKHIYTFFALLIASCNITTSTHADQTLTDFIINHYKQRDEKLNNCKLEMHQIASTTLDASTTWTYTNATLYSKDNQFEGHMYKWENLEQKPMTIPFSKADSNDHYWYLNNELIRSNRAYNGQNIVFFNNSRDAKTEFFRSLFIGNNIFGYILSGKKDIPHILTKYRNNITEESKRTLDSKEYNYVQINCDIGQYAFWIGLQEGPLIKQLEIVRDGKQVMRSIVTDYDESKHEPISKQTRVIYKVHNTKQFDKLWLETKTSIHFETTNLDDTIYAGTIEWSLDAADFSPEYPDHIFKLDIDEGALVFKTHEPDKNYLWRDGKAVLKSTKNPDGTFEVYIP
ncbi:hypothetical protein JD969_12975 [Planctomycetota bacterium]|nr:hypothetical protein JD969_12975 [Planctomycetota bacterium]